MGKRKPHRLKNHGRKAAVHVPPPVTDTTQGEAATGTPLEQPAALERVDAGRIPAQAEQLLVASEAALHAPPPVTNTTQGEAGRNNLQRMVAPKRAAQAEE